MTRLHPVAAAVVFWGAFAPRAGAQTPPVAGGQSPATPAQPQATSPELKVAPYPYAVTPRRSIVHTNPFPYPGYYRDDSTGGYRNPGGVGRYAEYYPPGNQFQIDPSQISHTASFDTAAGVPDRAEQLAAQQVGIARANSLQSHIDSYARPYFGLGVGYFGGAF
jgi:hypothetical protein